jgi:hypothetical protein
LLYREFVRLDILAHGSLSFHKLFYISLS